jgi:hypothetical protein
VPLADEHFMGALLLAQAAWAAGQQPCGIGLDRRPNPAANAIGYRQVFCGFDYLQHQSPIDPSSLTRWRERIRASGMERLLAAHRCSTGGGWGEAFQP